MQDKSGLQKYLDSGKLTAGMVSKIPLDAKRELIQILVEDDQDRKDNPLKYFRWDGEHSIPMQKAFAKDTVFEKWIFAGKGSGKTVIWVILAIIYLTGEYPDWWPADGKMPVPVWGTLVTSNIDRLLLPKLAEWMPKKYLRRGDIHTSYNEKKHILTLTNGSKCDLMTWDQELVQFKGPDRRFAGWDEHGIKGKYEEMKARVRGAGFRQVFGVLTPDEEQKGREGLWEIEELFERQYERDDLSIHRGYTGDNPYNGTDYMRRITENRTEDEKRILLWGEPLELIGLLFDINKNLHIRNPIEILPDYCVWESIDPHPSTNTAVTWTAILNTGEAITFEELWIDGNVRQIAKAIHDVRKKYGEMYGKMRVIKTLIDPSQYNATNIANKMKLSDMFRDPKVVGQENIVVVHPADNDYDSGVDLVRWWLEINKVTGRPRWTITKNCKNLIHSLTHMTRDEIKNKKIKHWSDCVRYTFKDEPCYIRLRSRDNEGRTQQQRSPLFRAF